MKVSKKAVGCVLVPIGLFLGFIVFSIFWGAYFEHKKSLTINEPVFSKKLEYYDIQGTTAAQLDAQIDLLGPKDEESGTGAKDKAGMTLSEINWDIKTKPKDGGCVLAGLTMTADFTVLYPKWVNQEQGGADAVQRWSRFITALEKHEEQHVADETQKANEIYQMLLNLPTDITDCEALVELAKQRTFEIDSKYVEVAKTYDTKSDRDAGLGLNDMGALTR